MPHDGAPKKRENGPCFLHWEPVIYELRVSISNARYFTDEKGPFVNQGQNRARGQNGSRNAYRGFHTGFAACGPCPGGGIRRAPDRPPVDAGAGTALV